jgi:hypothetical protein
MHRVEHAAITHAGGSECSCSATPCRTQGEQLFHTLNAPQSTQKREGRCVHWQRILNALEAASQPEAE